jgi:prepilin-type N-terminal cleavage/methylation domain-containing protein
MYSTRPINGFSLIEIMVALAILGFAVSQAFAVFNAQHKTFTRTESSIEVQQDVRIVAEAILSDIRMAGYMVPKQAGIASIDGRSSGADILCVSDAEKIADAEAIDAVIRFDRTRTTSLVDEKVSSATLEPADVDLDGDTNDDFIVDQGVIIVDGTSSHCGAISGITGLDSNVLAFAPNTPSGFDGAAGSTRAVPAIVYSVSGTDPLRNGHRVASQVEDLQIEFGVDGNADGLVADSEYQHDLNGQDPLDILAVRLSVITRADGEDASLDSTGRPAAANRTAGAVDGFRRRRITATIMPRNLQ